MGAKLAYPVYGFVMESETAERTFSLKKKKGLFLNNVSKSSAGQFNFIRVNLHTEAYQFTGSFPAGPHFVFWNLFT